jgi:isopentenyl diphosphate isomerase/L-lactate dehydrogenase-like FMN-dependent dehydrogenase
MARQAVNLEELRERARKRMPRIVFDYLDGAAEDEVTLRANRAAFEEIAFRARDLEPVHARSLKTTVLGHDVDFPVLIAPTGSSQVARSVAETAGARAAAAEGTILTVSTVASDSVEDVARAAPGRVWFQLYMPRDRGLATELVKRAEAAGAGALMLTIDTAVLGRRERDHRNRATVPPTIRPGLMLDAARHPAWLLDFARRRKFIQGNWTNLIPGVETPTFDQLNEQFPNAELSWEHVEWLRGVWKRPLLLKGVLSAETTRRAIEHGCDGVLVSNHGGRQLDGMPATIRMLPEVVDAAEGRLEVLLDGGVRRGTDVVKALALGAEAVLVGRPWLFSLAAGGEEGVRTMLRQLRAEIDNALALLGCPDVRQLDRSYLRMPGDRSPLP